MGQSGFGIVGRAEDDYLVQGSFPAAGGEVPFGMKGLAVRNGGDSVRTVFRNAEEASIEEPRAISIGGGTVMVARALPTAGGGGFMVMPELRQWDDRFLVTDPAAGRLDTWGTDGRLVASLRFGNPRIAVTDAIWAAQVDLMVRRARGGGVATSGGGSFAAVVGGGAFDTAQMRRDMLAQEHADSLPRFSGIVVTPNGTVWVREYQVPGSDEWLIRAFDRDGRIIGRLSGNDGNPPLLIGDDRVLFRSEDDLGIATFEVRKLVWPSPD